MLDPLAAARDAGLRYVDDRSPGIRREATSLGLRFIGPDGRVIRGAADLKRLRALAVPPAWTDVWMCPDPRGHIQATGRDARGRKQYRYHPEWRTCRDGNKFDRLAAFAAALPVIRTRTSADLGKPGLPREKVLAAVVQLLEKSLIRVGNDEYARTNGSFGLTTLHDTHVTVSGPRMRFAFRGKSGVRHEVDVEDTRLARIVRNCRDLPGQELFQYVNDAGEVCDIGSGDVNEYLRAITGQDFSAKDFRTWAGTVLAASALAALTRYDSHADAKRNVVKAIEAVAGLLGNTKAVCRKSYVHPAVIDGYMDGSMAQTLERCASDALRGRAGRLRRDERVVLALLQRRLKQAGRPGTVTPVVAVAADRVRRHRAPRRRATAAKARSSRTNAMPRKPRRKAA